MNITCAALHCPVYKKDDCLRVFNFPFDSELQKIWSEHAVKNLCKEYSLSEEFYLCEIHFDDQFIGGNGRDNLKSNAVPKIFQFSTPVEYIRSVCNILTGLGSRCEFLSEALRFIKEIEEEGNTNCPSVDQEVLIELGTVPVSFELQSKRILRKKRTLTERQNENKTLKCMYQEKLNMVVTTKILENHLGL